MLALAKNNKGFNVLELIITLVIVGIISAVAYPNFSDWRKEREARGSVVKIKNAIQAINSQVKRGLYGFVFNNILASSGVLFPFITLHCRHAVITFSQ